MPSIQKAYTQNYPAVHLKVNSWNYFCNFSSELLVAVALLLVVGFNIYFLRVTPEFSDHSLAAQLLDYHSDLNQKLHAHYNAIKTVVVKQNSFVSEAYAEDFSPLSADSAQNTSQTAGSDTFVINDNTMVKPNPDSVANLIAKQIKVYETQNGDSLASIAKKFNISKDTLVWANNLAGPNTMIKAGWQLLVLPTNGVVHKASANDTLPDIAKKYHGNLETIISYNGLANAEDIEPGQIVMVPGGQILPILAAIKPKPKPGSHGKMPSAIAGDWYGGYDHTFPKGYCTYWVAKLVGGLPWGGNAKNWLVNAKAFGAVISRQPAPNTILVTNENARFGHVAYVKKVEPGRILVSEMNYDAFNRVDERWIDTNSSVIKGFIYR